MLVRGNAPPGTDERVAAAAERALDESRRAITALTSTVDEPLHLAVARAAEDVAGRVGLKVLVEASPLVQVTPDIREALARIVREAVSNAGRHGEAQEVRISLTADRTLRITDDGRGFDPLRPKDGRYGLVSMRERAERIGGKLNVISSSGNGTTIEVRLP
jgi:signal transduction histidine kinase